MYALLNETRWGTQSHTAEDAVKLGRGRKETRRQTREMPYDSRRHIMVRSSLGSAPWRWASTRAARVSMTWRELS